MDKTWLIVDVSNLAHRSGYAHSELKTSTDRFSGHIFGSVGSLLHILNTTLASKDVKMVFCYDGKSCKDYRRTILPEYKMNRMPRDINPTPEVSEILKMWPGIQIEEDSKEGDDAIAYAVKMLNGKDCVVFSGDRDLWQLTQYPNCRVLSPNLKRFVEPSDILEEYHLDNKPSRICLAKSLFGDPSDGIKGVERLIKKQVAPILNAEGVETPEEFYNKLGSVKPSFITDKNWEKLNTYKDKVFKNFLVVQPQLDFDKSSVTKVENSSLVDMRCKLAVDYECYSLLDKIDQLNQRYLNPL